MIDEKINVILLAAGEGKRIDSSIPKQFITIAGVPILIHTFNAFKHLNNIEFHLVLNHKHVDYWKSLCLNYNFNIPHNICIGGPTRYHSVKSGLKEISINSLVLIHDGVRPFVSHEAIENVIKTTGIKGNAVPVVEISESVRLVEGIHNKSVEREKIKVFQTPQGFISSHIKDAYNNVYNPDLTDDASVLESTGRTINLVPGNKENIKITTSIDLLLAESFLSSKL